MNEYSYTAANSAGQAINGTRKAKSKDDLLKYLNNQGLTVTSIHEKTDAVFKKLSSVEIGGISLAQRVLIAKQMATMITAGIPIIQVVGIMIEQMEKPSIKEKFEEVYRKIESGMTLSKAFDQVGGIFSEVQINLLAAGEKSGNLNEMLIKVAEDLEKSKSLRGKILGALIYPVIIFVVLIIIVFVMIAFMIPQVKELYASLGQTDEALPFVTKLLVQIGEGFSNPIFIGILIALAVSGAIGYRVFVSKKERKLIVDSIKLRVPVFGNLMKKIQLSEFCRINSMLIKSGIPIIDAIQITSKAMSNTVFEKILIDSKEEVSKGISFSLSIAKNNIKDAFPSILVKVIATGEESGKLDKVLEDMYKYYDSEVEQITSNLTKLLEPFILLVVGGMVAFLAVAVYLPIYSIGSFT